ncbi:toxin co-regulated pilus biosynthesis Q family protein [Burkholderia vietnamiensis]|uniref:toxin co-regulated pilus biosynthesis Q family protein n=1 Tax=Burkholderia vietnamiensis TaxID=60552 RepID=UPI00075417A1|nr:toxin co-regulated pilus biosynthesis Q family protein [Burkholderia vietnamiensis]KVR89451.1 hypothetical protein WK28_23865 [Burkholderia vietnamiensis]
MKHLLVALGAAAPLTAIAGFQVVNEPPLPAVVAAAATAPATAGAVPSVSVAEAPLAAPDAASAGSQGIGLIAVRYTGTPDKVIPVRTGFGRDLKLPEALKQIAPPGWTPMFNDGVVESFIDRNRLVSWRGGRKWTEVLDILASENNLVVDLDWSRHTLNANFKAMAPKMPSVTAAPSAPAAPVVMSWIAKSGSTLRTAVTEWATKEGWQVVWGPTFDYPIVSQLSFDGSFLDAIVGVFRSYEKADRPLLVDVHAAQKLLYITARP